MSKIDSSLKTEGANAPCYQRPDMTNTLQAVASLPPGHEASSWPEISDFVKLHERIFLGTYRYETKCTLGMEMRAKITAFGKLAFIQISLSEVKKRPSHQEALKLRREFDEWADWLYETAARQSGIDLSSAREFAEPTLWMIYQPEAGATGATLNAQ